MRSSLFSFVLLIACLAGCAHSSLLERLPLPDGDTLVVRSNHRFERTHAERTDPKATETLVAVGAWRTVGADLPVIELSTGGMLQVAIHDAGVSVTPIVAHDPATVSPAERLFYFSVPGTGLFFLPELLPGLGGAPGYATAGKLHNTLHPTPPKDFDILVKIAIDRWSDGEHFWSPMTAGDALMLYHLEPGKLDGREELPTPHPEHPEKIPFSDILIVRRGEAAKSPGGFAFTAHGVPMSLVVWLRPGTRSPQDDAELKIVREALIAALQH
jgi:hypothetical protein